MPIEPGVLCERELPCDARFELKWWRLMTPEKPLPLVVPVTSTIWPTREHVDADDAPALNLASSSARDAEFPQHGARFDARLGEMARRGLGHARGATLAERDLHGGVAVGLRRLDLRDAVVGDVEHRHRDGAAVIREDARHADLATDKSEDIILHILSIMPARLPVASEGAGCNWPAVHLRALTLAPAQ